MAEYFVRVQRRKTVKYGPTQHHQDSVTIPAHVSEALKLQPGQIMKCILNCNGNSLTYTKVKEKPSSERIRYEDWRDIVRKVAPIAEEWKTYEQIRREGNIPIKTAPAYWVKLAESDIGLVRKRDTKTNRILWGLAKGVKKDATSGKLTLRDAKLTDLIC
jgi:bifunctional DNA-binding transcriptional regulator/antitoxin component of YhaV-PrlF toxin-antitoxin module